MSTIPYSNTMKVVSVADSAIDTSATDLVRYSETRDWNLLHFKAGSSPTVFHLRQLPLAVRFRLNEVGSKFGSHLTIMEFFKHCVSKVENLRREDGTVIGVWEPTNPLTLAPGKTISTIDEAAMEEYFSCLPQTILEIGGIAYDRSFLDSGSERKFAMLRSLPLHTTDKKSP